MLFFVLKGQCHEKNKAFYHMKCCQRHPIPHTSPFKKYLKKVMFLENWCVNLPDHGRFYLHINGSLHIQGGREVHLCKISILNSTFVEKVYFLREQVDYLEVKNLFWVLNREVHLCRIGHLFSTNVWFFGRKDDTLCMEVKIN